MWTINDVPEHFDPIAALADKYGYIAALFGSTLKHGTGRDLDVMMLSRFREKQDWRGFLNEFGGTEVRRFERPERSNHSYEVEREGKLFHFIFGKF